MMVMGADKLYTYSRFKATLQDASSQGGASRHPSLTHLRAVWR